VITIALALPLALWPLDSTDGGFLPGGTPGQWEWGTALVGPADEGRVWGTNLDGSYLNDAADVLEIPLPDLSEASDPVLVMRHWYRTQPGDHGTLQIDDGGGWSRAEPVYGYPHPDGFSGESYGWVESSLHLAGYGPNPRVRLAFESDVAFSLDGWYIGQVGVYDGDATPPEIAPLLVPGDTQDPDGPYPVVMLVEDDHQVQAASVVYRLDNGPEAVVALMDLGDGTWTADIPGQPPGTVVSWYAVASDGDQSARWPELEEVAFKVYLAAPTDLRGPEGRIVGTETLLAWTPPDSPHPVVGYQVTETGFEEEPVDVAGVSAVVPLHPDGTHQWTVRAAYDLDGAVLHGEPSEPLALLVEVPYLDPLDPGFGYQGERLWVELDGESLYLDRNETDLRFGRGVGVESLEVLDVGHAMARVFISPTATLGFRDARIDGPHGVFNFPEVFEVRAGGEGPGEVEVTPQWVVQGETALIRVRVGTPFAGPVVVDPGPDLLVTSEVVSEGQEASFEILALGRAGPGERTVLLDDGERVWAAPLEVREYVAPLKRGCSTVPGNNPLAGLIAVLALLRRRRGSVVG
jgi:hypothetical protein